MRHCSGGQAAMVDAILFMTVMLIASAVVIGSTGQRPSDSSGVQQYVGDFAQTILATELANLHYTDVDGNVVFLGDSGRSIGRLLCDEAVILDSGRGPCDFSSYEDVILTAGSRLIRPGLDFAISCNGGAVFISGDADSISELPHNRCARQAEILIDGTSSVTITVYVWVV